MMQALYCSTSTCTVVLVIVCVCDCVCQLNMAATASYLIAGIDLKSWFPGDEGHLLFALVCVSLCS